jgi:hypothetical protein
VESPDRFARDLAVQLAGHDHLKSLGVTLIPATAPDHFIEDTPTAVIVRQVLVGAPALRLGNHLRYLFRTREFVNAEHSDDFCGGGTLRLFRLRARARGRRYL